MGSDIGSERFASQHEEELVCAHGKKTKGLDWRTLRKEEETYGGRTQRVRLERISERKKERKQSAQTRDGGGGQGPHLREQDFGRTIRGTGVLLLLTRDTTGSQRGAPCSVEPQLHWRSHLSLATASSQPFSAATCEKKSSCRKLRAQPPADARSLSDVCLDARPHGRCPAGKGCASLDDGHPSRAPGVTTGAPAASL